MFKGFTIAFGATLGLFTGLIVVSFLAGILSTFIN